MLSRRDGRDPRRRPAADRPAHGRHGRGAHALGGRPCAGRDLLDGFDALAAAELTAPVTPDALRRAADAFAPYRGHALFARWTDVAQEAIVREARALSTAGQRAAVRDALSRHPDLLSRL
jgi:hypothetical protein